MENITHCVPQGSILGPLLFIIYTNDLQKSLESCKSILYADDTTLFKSDAHPDELFKQVNKDLENLQEWFKSNKLSLNTSKTFYILFQNNRKAVDKKLKIVMNSTPIEKKTSIKFLGMLVDSQLNWHDHIQYIKCKISGSLYAINKVKFTLPTKYLVTLYYSLIYPYITYGISLWGNTHKSQTNKILILQKKALRAINRANYNEHTNNLFSKLMILKLPELYTWHVAKYMYRFSKGMLPKSISTTFTTHGSFHEYSTRNRQNIAVPLHKSAAGKNCLFHTGPKIWNDLENSIKNLPT